MPNFNLGERALVTGQFNTISDGTPVDPTQVRVKVRDPQGLITTYVYLVGPTVVKLGTGQYQISVLLNKPGAWLVRFEGNSSNEAAEETTVFADGSAFYSPLGVETPDS